MPFVTTRDGTRLSYEDHGAGTAIVFAASWSLNADMWEYQVAHFVEQGYRCVAYDRRGHGRSDRPSGGYDLDTLADDLADLVDHLDLRGAVLVGHCAGSAEVARYVARHGEGRTAAVAFLSTTLPFLKQTADNPDGLPEHIFEAALKQYQRDRPKWFTERAQGFFATHLGNDVSPALIDHLTRRCLSASAMATIEVWRTMFHADHRAALAALTVPALIVHGTADQSAPVERTGHRAAELVPGCIYREYPTAGHGLFVTHRDTLHADLLALIKN